MQRFLVLLLVFVCATANSQIFRRIGPDGRVYFPDQPGPDAERVDATPAQTISLPSVPEQSETEAAETQGDATIEDRLLHNEDEGEVTENDESTS